MRRQIALHKRWLIPASLALICAVASVVPWSTAISIPVVVEPSQLARTYSPRPATITAVHVSQNQIVAAGAPLVSLISDQLEHDIQIAGTEIARLKAQLARLTADDSDRENSVIFARELASHQIKLQGLDKEKAELEIRAPFAGRILELNPALHAGRTISQKEMIALIGADSGFIARGYVSEADLMRLHSGEAGRLIPEQAMRPALQVTIRDISIRGAQAIDVPDLASTNGGRIAVQPDQQHKLEPVSAVYAVTLAVEDSAAIPDQRYRGVAQVHGDAESFAIRVWRQVAKVLIRESGA